MKLDEKGYSIIMDFEGLKLKPYLCSAKVPTIGYGNTFYPNGKKVTMLDKAINKEYAIEIFKFVADDFATKVLKLVKSKVTQNQFNALVSIAYNIGIGALAKSTLLKLVNINPTDGNIAKEFLKWNKAGGRIVAGLTTRRIKESALYYTK